MDRRPRLSLDLLRAFRSAAAHQSFTRAGQELSLTQSAISRAVHTLEEQLGQLLFHRVNRALKLTHAGETLYRATADALTLIEAATDRLTGADRSLGVTTTAALASLWLAPRLPAFTRSHPGVDVRVVGTNDRIDLDREHLDVAILFVPAWETAPDAVHLVDYRLFPVCSPVLARSRAAPLRTPADLENHVRLDFETIVYGRPWYDWEHWAERMHLQKLVPASTLRFSHYDQTIRAALDGSGVAIGKWPHVSAQLRDGALCAPLGPTADVPLGAYYLVFGRAAASREIVARFVAWLKAEFAQDEAARASGTARRRVTPSGVSAAARVRTRSRSA